MQTDNLNLYIFMSIIIHALFPTTFNATYIQRDISQIGGGYANTDDYVER